MLLGQGMRIAGPMLVQGGSTQEPSLVLSPRVRWEGEGIWAGQGQQTWKGSLYGESLEGKLESVGASEFDTDS